MDSIYQNPLNPTYDGHAHYFGPSGYPTISVDVQGEFTAGGYTPSVSNDGNTWYPVNALMADGTPTPTIEAVGLYRINFNGFQLFKLEATGDFSGTTAVSTFASPKVLT